jgi:hypothetical protein
MIGILPFSYIYRMKIFYSEISYKVGFSKRSFNEIDGVSVFYLHPPHTPRSIHIRECPYLPNSATTIYIFKENTSNFCILKYFKLDTHKIFRFQSLTDFYYAYFFCSRTYRIIHKNRNTPQSVYGWVF